METGRPILWSFYVYAPNKGAPIFFTIAYACSAAGHLWQCYQHKAFRLMGLHSFCAILFTAGYALREWGAYNYLYTGNSTTLILYILSQVFIYVAPPLLELANYHILGRMFIYAPSFAPVPAGTTRRIFSLLMMVVETINSLGVALAANVHGNSQGLGRILTLLALALQLCVGVSFAGLAAWFHRRCVQAKAHATISTTMKVLYASTSLILIRCIYRLIEHLGNSVIEINNLAALEALTPVLRYEWFFYVFEATLMLVNSIIWNIWNPVRYLPSNVNLYLSQDGQTELLREDAEDSGKRPLVLRVASALTFGLYFRRKQHSFCLEEASGSYPLATRQD